MPTRENEGERVKGLRFYPMKAGKKAYLCYILPYLSYGLSLAVGLR